MPPQVGSRFTFVLGVLDAGGVRYLTEREPYRYVAYADNRTHVVGRGDTMFGLAGRYFDGLPRAAGYWWAIADFQPDPIFDPTLELELGRVVVIPSARVLTEVILGERRRQETG